MYAADTDLLDVEFNRYLAYLAHLYSPTIDIYMDNLQAVDHMLTYSIMENSFMEVEQALVRGAALGARYGSVVSYCRVSNNRLTLSHP